MSVAEAMIRSRKRMKAMPATSMISEMFSFRHDTRWRIGLQLFRLWEWPKRTLGGFAQRIAGLPNGSVSAIKQVAKSDCRESGDRAYDSGNQI